MTRHVLAALAALSLLGACAAPEGSYVAGRAANDMLRFSASNYSPPAGLMLKALR